MHVYELAAALILILIAHRASVIFYRLYLHPLADYPGPKLAAASTLYRAFYQLFKDGEMLHKVIQLHETYGPVIRISPNELEFCRPSAYHDIYNSSFNGEKDPNYYDHLRGEEDTFFVKDDDPKEYKARFRPIAPLFSNKHYGQHEDNIKDNVEKLASLLSLSAQAQKPCSIAAGYLSLSSGVVNEFLFSDVPEPLKTLSTAEFDDPLTVAAEDAFNWTLWLTRNFPLLSTAIAFLPPSLVSFLTKGFDSMNETTEIIAKLMEHEKDPKTVKNPDCMMQRLIHHQPPDDSTRFFPYSDGDLRSEAMGLLLAGIADPPNVLAYGTFVASQDASLQQRLHEELKSVWPNVNDSIPSHKVLRQLPVLRGLVKESLRLTYGLTTGPPRLVHEGGAIVDGYKIPAGAVVAASSYFVHMDEAQFSAPERFEVDRWAVDDHVNPLVAFSRGRRMCPAEQLRNRFSNILMFATFATVFRKFHVDAYETTMKDFEWKQYVSNRFAGRPLRVMLQEKEE